jgi:hypothetical protein
MRRERRRAEKFLPWCDENREFFLQRARKFEKQGRKERREGCETGKFFTQ